MKWFNQKQVQYIDKNYREHRGALEKKYRSFLGKYVFVIEEDGIRSKIYVEKSLYDTIKTGELLTVGEMNHKIINIRQGICKNTDDEK